jgi:glucose/arabinose dehydrogenase
VLVMHDGSLLISDDYAGAIYRVTYGSARAAGR